MAGAQPAPDFERDGGDAAGRLDPLVPDPASAHVAAARRWPGWLERAFSAAALVWAAWAVAQFLYVAVMTVDYPYHLEWMEGGVVETVDRVMRGLDIYGPPSVDYVPYIYNPLYYFVSGAFGAVMGVDLFACRLVSLLAILGTAAITARWIWCETGAWAWALVGVGLLFASFDISGRWFHLARVDSLFLLLVFAGAYALRFAAHMRGALVAGALFWLAFLTKQSALGAAAVPLCFMLAVAPRRAIVAGATLAVLAGASVVALELASDGWYLYYTWEVPRMHATVDGAWEGFWRWDVWRMALAGGAALLALGLVTGRRWRVGLFHLGFAGGLLATAWMSRLHSGGWLNVLMPAYAALALLAPLGGHAIATRAAAGERERLGGSPTVMALAVALMMQLFAIDYRTAHAIPPDGAQERGDRFLAHLAAIPGEVLLPDHRWIQTWADKRSYGLGMAARDLLRIEDPEDPGRVRLEAELKAAFREQRFAAVILSEEHFMVDWLRPTYRFDRTTELAPTPVTGWAIKPRWIWVPR